MYSSNNASSPQQEGLGPLRLPPPTTNIFSYPTDLVSNQPATNLANTLPPLNLPSTATTKSLKQRNDRSPWTSEEDNLLRLAVQIYGEKSEKWSKIAACVPGRTNKNCRKRWFHSLDPSLRKGPWTTEEDDLLRAGYAQYQGKWSKIAETIPGRTDDQCAKRWRESLNPEILKQHWTQQEDELLEKKYAEYGSQWQQIAGFFPGRPGLHCRNRWRKIQRNLQKRTESMTIDNPNETILMTANETSLNISTTSLMHLEEEISPFSDSSITTPNILEETILPIPTMSPIIEGSLRTTGSLEEVYSGTLMEDNLATTSTASSDPSIASLLSPSLPISENQPRNLELIETSTNSLLSNAHSPVKTPMGIRPDNVSTKKPYGCGISGCVYNSPNSDVLYYHMKRAHPTLNDIDQPFQCAIPGCNKRYKNINGLVYHINYAKGSSGHPNNGSEEVNSEAASKPHKCTYPGCKKSYKNSNGLRYHLNKAHEAKMAIGGSNPNKKSSVTSKRKSLSHSANRMNEVPTSDSLDLDLPGVNCVSYSSSNDQFDVTLSKGSEIYHEYISNFTARSFQAILPRPSQ